jgi:hypothetical protein
LTNRLKGKVRLAQLVIGLEASAFAFAGFRLGLAINVMPQVLGDFDCIQ